MTGLSLADLASLAEILGTCSIITGLLFGTYQIRAHRTKLRNTIAVELSNTFLNAELARAVALLHRLPDDSDGQQLRTAGPEFEQAAVVVTTSFETMGLLVHRGVADLDLVMDLAGGMVGSMYRKLHRWVEWTRAEQNQPSWAEWFEWLASHSDCKQPLAPTPAHQHKDPARQTPRGVFVFRVEPAGLEPATPALQSGP
jgi:hypothetical protein